MITVGRFCRVTDPASVVMVTGKESVVAPATTGLEDAARGTPPPDAHPIAINATAKRGANFLNTPSSVLRRVERPGECSHEPPFTPRTDIRGREKAT
jgi:hypothetical protein